MKKRILRRKKPALKRPKRIKKSTKKAAKGLTKEIVCLGLHNLQAPSGSHRRKKLLGRGAGSGHGKTSTRGSKGQTSRSGRDFYLGFEGGQSPLIRRFPKRGFNSRSKLEYQVVNLGDLKKLQDTVITPVLLKEKGLIKNSKRPVKILANGEFMNPVTLSAHAFSRKAVEKIKNAGGSFEVLNV